jgi:hypothetical protein
MFGHGTLHSPGTFLLLLLLPLESTHVPRPVFVTVIRCSRNCENTRALAMALRGFTQHTADRRALPEECNPLEDSANFRYKRLEIKKKYTTATHTSFV